MNTRCIGRRTVAFLVLLAGILALASCFSPYTGADNQGRFVIGGSSSRAFFDTTNLDEIAKLTLDITVSNGPGPDQRKTSSGNIAVPFVVIPGTWTISVHAYYEGRFAAYGSTTMNITAGDNNVVVTMQTIDRGFYKIEGRTYTKIPLDLTDNVTTVVDHINNNPAADYLLVLGGPVSVMNPYTLNHGALTLVGDTINTPRICTLSATETESMFTIGGGTETASLTIGNDITLNGHSGNSDALVTVNANGTFTMAGNSIIQGNTNDGSGSTQGGGVYIHGGHFVIKDSSLIDNNTAEWSGGGVYVDRGSFDMRGGTISNNFTNTRDGGGVYVSVGSFTMQSGEIMRNDAANLGGGVYIEVTAGGSFSKTGGTIYGSDNTNANTAYAASPADTHAVYANTGLTSYKYRATTVKEGERLTTANNTGWTVVP